MNKNMESYVCPLSRMAKDQRKKNNQRRCPWLGFGQEGQLGIRCTCTTEGHENAIAHDQHEEQKMAVLCIIILSKPLRRK